MIPPEATDDASAQALIKDIITCLGGTADRTGSIGVTAEKVDAFFADLTAYVTWVQQKSSSKRHRSFWVTPLEAKPCSALRAIRGKADDFFARVAGWRLSMSGRRWRSIVPKVITLAIAARDLEDYGR